MAKKRIGKNFNPSYVQSRLLHMEQPNSKELRAIKWTQNGLYYKDTGEPCKNQNPITKNK